MARDTEQMLPALRRVLKDGDRITGVSVLSAGHSNDTFLLEGLDRVLRTPPSGEGLLPPYDMARQHAVLSAVKAHAPEVPVPQVYEEDEAVIGAPFFVMERLSGGAFEYAVPDWLASASPSTPDAMCRQWFEAVAALHRMDVAHMPPGGRSVGEEAAYWLKVAQEAEGAPEMIQVLADLAARPPRTSGPPTPVHGDPKHGNCMWSDGGRLTALLDWEMAQRSEPLLDLGYILMFHDQGEASLANAGFDLPGWWSPRQMIDFWEQALGRTAVDIDRYAVLAQAKISAIISLGHHLFVTGKSHDQRLGGWGVVLPAYNRLLCQRATKAG
jgi:aminoglycoside phosphotransferase (APT) family kinase protein